MSKMNGLKSWRTTEILEGAFVALLGGFALFAPSLLLKLFSFVVGAGILLYGIVQLVKVFREKGKSGQIPRFALVSGILAAVAGVYFLCNRQTPVAMIAIVFGIWSVIAGALQINRAIAAKQAGQKSTWLYIQSIVKLGVGLFLLVNPWRGSELWIQFIGVYLVYLGAAFIISVFTATQEPL